MKFPVFFMAFILSGCFAPLEQDLSFIYVDPIPNRLGQLLRNALQNDLGSSQKRKSLYHLRLKAGSESIGTDIERDATFQQTTTIVRADFDLLKGEDILLSGSVIRDAALPFSPANPYMSQAGTTSITQELVQQVSEDIRLDLLIFFKESNGLSSP